MKFLKTNEGEYPVGTAVLVRGRIVKWKEEGKEKEKEGCVFSGELLWEKDDKVCLRNARRIFYWEGAASLSQLAAEGVKNAGKCLFPREVGEVIIHKPVETIKLTEAAVESINSVKIWEATAQDYEDAQVAIEKGSIKEFVCRQINQHE
jgi:hypothetical protein